MNTKVEICGINTSSLTVMPESEKVKLLHRVKQGDSAAREELVSGNLKLVLSVIQRFGGRGESPDDLFQVGCIGLIKAIDNFSFEHEVRFSTYAVPMIIGEIRRFLRDNNSVRVSRSLRDLAYRAMAQNEILQKKNGNEPTVSEIAGVLGVDSAQVAQALESIVEPVSLYEPVINADGDDMYIIDRLGEESCEDGWLCEIEFRKAVESLKERERRILGLRFMRGQTQVEVADAIGISQAQVSRLEKNALAFIKSSL